jgi:hypothetical protein
MDNIDTPIIKYKHLMTTIELIIMYVIIVCYVISLITHILYTRQPGCDTDTHSEDKWTFAILGLAMGLTLFVWPLFAWFNGTWGRVKQNNSMFFVIIMFVLSAVCSIGAFTSMGLATFSHEQNTQEKYNSKVASIIFSVLTIVFIASGCGIKISRIDKFKKIMTAVINK